MLRIHRPLFLLTLLGVAGVLAVYVGLGSVKPSTDWKLIDIAGEASTAIMAAVWLVLVIHSRPPGRATTLLAAGLAGLALGAGADCLDEFFALPKASVWNHLVESGLTLAGMASLTWGLGYWRREQLMLSEHLQKRERLFRDHRSFDQLTQLADADYLRQQLRCEFEQRPAQACLLMLDLNDFHLINRAHGQREGDRLLQALTHLLLLNLRSTDLLCRYAGDRFAVLLPATPVDTAHAIGAHLRRAVAGLRHHRQCDGLPVHSSVRYACRPVDAEPNTLLLALNRSLERRMPEQRAAPGWSAGLASNP